MKKTFKYGAFGLNILSALELPELISTDFGQPDIEIAWGTVPDELPGYTSRGVLYRAKPGKFLFRLDTVGKYLVEEGKSIRIERLNNSSDQEVRLFLLGSSIGALLHQREMLPFHGSTVVKDGKAIIISGNSGTGKSTLAAVLVNRGYKLLADDISVIDFKDKSAMVYPGIPHLKLWEDVLGKMGDTTDYEKVRPQLMKFRKPVKNAREEKPMPAKRIILLSIKNTEGFTAKNIKGVEKFNALKTNTYRSQFMEGLGVTKSHFDIITRLSGCLEVVQVKRPPNPLLLEELADFVEGLGRP